MKAVRFYSDLKTVEVIEADKPKIKEDEVLIDIKATGICGSDVHILKGVTKVGFSPITLGHEFSGVITEVGANIKDWKIGDRVCSHCVINCGECKNCLNGRPNICTSRRLIGIHENGAMAEYCAVPAKLLIKLPDNVPFDIGAISTDAVATPYHALKTVGKIKEGESVVIYGIGGLGYSAVKLAKLFGASPIIAVGVSDERLERAKHIGADYTINSIKETPESVIEKITNGGADIAFEFVGLPETIAQAVNSVRIGGRTVVCGIGDKEIVLPPAATFVRREGQFMGSYSYTVKEIGEVISLVSEGKLDLRDIITERLPLEEAETALDHLKNKVGNPIRIVITQD